MSSIDSAIYTTQYLIYTLKNYAPESPIFTLGKHQTEVLIDLDIIFDKATPQVRPPRVVPPETEGKNQQIIENNSDKKKPDHEKPTRVPMVEEYPEEFQQVHPIKTQTLKMKPGTTKNTTPQKHPQVIPEDIEELPYNRATV